MFRVFLFAITALLLLTGCPGGKVVRENEEVNRWIHAQMDKSYLWTKEMPADWEERIHSNPEIFFKRLLYTVEGDISLSDTYSNIVYVGDPGKRPDYDEGSEYAAIQSMTYGFGMQFSYTASQEMNYGQVIQVAAGSPADRAGIKRGDSFHIVNGSRIQKLTELSALLESEVRMEIEFFYPEEKTVQVRKEYYADNPLCYHTVFDLQPVTGYIVYNHFTDGNGDDYYNELKNVFAEFRTAGVENIILDLRYNGGGELSAARKLCSLLAPPSALGGIYLYKEYNDSFGLPEGFESQTLMTTSQVNGYNCGDCSLYVITGRNTASASELLIHCLRPLYEREGLKFMQVGARTDGKNVGGTWFSNPKYEWEFYPITFRVHNLDRVSGYEYGIIPDLELGENHRAVQTDGGDYVMPIGDWGNIEQELLLRAVMDDIYGYGGWTPLLPETGGARALSMPRTVQAAVTPQDITRTTVRPRLLLDN